MLLRGFRVAQQRVEKIKEYVPEGDILVDKDNSHVQLSTTVFIPAHPSH
jgi:hypothetical protein